MVPTTRSLDRRGSTLATVNQNYVHYYAETMAETGTFQCKEEIKFGQPTVR